MFLNPFIDLHGAEYTNQQKLAFIQPIEKHAMIYGEGSKKVYLFVDPKCPHSRDFMEMIHDNAKMRTMYQYHIFFYELKRFDTHTLIATIYGSPAPLQKTLEVMVGAKEIPIEPKIDPRIEAKIQEISNVATTIGVSKRPYLIIMKENN